MIDPKPSNLITVLIVNHFCAAVNIFNVQISIVYRENMYVIQYGTAQQGLMKLTAMKQFARGCLNVITQKFALWQKTYVIL